MKNFVNTVNIKKKISLNIRWAFLQFINIGSEIIINVYSRPRTNVRRIKKKWENVYGAYIFGFLQDRDVFSSKKRFIDFLYSTYLMCLEYACSLWVKCA